MFTLIRFWIELNWIELEAESVPVRLQTFHELWWLWKEHVITNSTFRSVCSDSLQDRYLLTSTLRRLLKAIPWRSMPASTASEMMGMIIRRSILASWIRFPLWVKGFSRHRPISFGWRSRSRTVSSTWNQDKRSQIGTTLITENTTKFSGKQLPWKWSIIPTTHLQRQRDTLHASINYETGENQCSNPHLRREIFKYCFFDI